MTRRGRLAEKIDETEAELAALRRLALRAAEYLWATSQAPGADGERAGLRDALRAARGI